MTKFADGDKLYISKKFWLMFDNAEDDNLSDADIIGYDKWEGRMLANGVGYMNLSVSNPSILSVCDITDELCECIELEYCE